MTDKQEAELHVIFTSSAVQRQHLVTPHGFHNLLPVSIPVVAAVLLVVVVVVVAVALFQKPLANTLQ